MTLSSRLIRLAHEQPSLREHLLPLLKEAKQDADTQYKVRLREVRGHLDKISDLVTKHEFLQSNEPRNWGYVGDLGYVAEELGNVVRFLKNEDH